MSCSHEETGDFMSMGSPPLSALRVPIAPEEKGTATTSPESLSEAKWDRRFMELADLVASWSKDPRTKVGAVITMGNRVVSVGFNGLPQFVEDTPEILNDRPKKNLMTLHAEVNAIMFSKSDGLNAHTIYVTKPPCAQCAAQIIQSGIIRVVFRPDESMTTDDVWLRSCYTALQMFEMADVEIETIC